MLTCSNKLVPQYLKAILTKGRFSFVTNEEATTRISRY